MVDGYRARPAARGAAVRPPERRSRDCRRRETPSNAPVRAETCEIRNQRAPEVAQGYEALVGPAQARDDGRRARADAETASPSSSERLERPEKRNPSPRFQLRPIKNEHLLNLRPPRRRQRRSPLRILSSESPRRRPGSPPPKSRTLEATRSRPWDQGTGPLSAPTSAYRATTARCSRQQPRQALLAASSRQCEKCEIKTGNRCRKWWG